MWHDIRPYLGHALFGMGVALMLTMIALTALAAWFVGYTADGFIWAGICFVTGIVAMFGGSLLYMSAPERTAYADLRA